MSSQKYGPLSLSDNLTDDTATVHGPIGILEDSIPMHNTDPQKGRIDTTVSGSISSQRRSSSDRELIVLRIFTIVSVYGLLMVINNIAQVFTLHHFTYLTLNIVPCVLTVLEILLLVAYICLNDRWKDIYSLWGESARRRRVALVGVVLSLQIPIIVCQFFYMNRFAMPKYRQRDWSTTLEFKEYITPPGLIVAWYAKSYTLTNPSQAWFWPSAEYGFGTCEGPNNTNCEDSMEWNQTYTDSYGNTVYYHQYKPGGMNLSPGHEISLNLYTQWSSNNTSILPYLTFAFYDQDYHGGHAIPDLMYSENCSLVNAQWGPALGSTRFFLEKYETHDKANALSVAGNGCWTDASKSTSPYATYKTGAVHVAPRNSSTCNFAQTNDGTVCNTNIQMTYSSQMVQTQTSEYGTNWLGILTDEGSIAGGITFFTFFLGVFVI